MKTAANFHKHAIALAMAQMLMLTAVQAATINVDDNCSLREAIISANNDSQENGCEQGSGDDTIVLPATSTIELSEVDALGDGDSGTPLISSNVTIQGNSATIIREQSAPDFRLLEVTSGGGLTIDSLNIANGRGKSGAGIYADNANTLVLTNSVVSDNDAESLIGGGILAVSTDVYIRDSVVEYNNARISGVYVDSGSLYMSDSSVSSNSCSNGGCGVRMYFPEAAITIRDSQIRYNSGGNTSSGVHVFGEIRADVTISNSVVSNNTASTRSGVIMNTYSHTLTNSQLTITDSEISNNVATAQFSDGTSGLIVLGKDDLLLENSNVDGNSGISNEGVAGVMLQGNGYLPTSTIRNSDISANIFIPEITSPSSPASRTGLSVSGASSVQLDDVRITENRSATSSAIYTESSSVTLTNVELTNNYSVNAEHAPIQVSDSSLTIDQTTIADNSSAQGHGAILVQGSTSNVSILRSSISGNQSPALEGSALQVDDADSVEIANSTISSNFGLGAAIVLSSANTVSFINATIADNQYAGGAGGVQVVSQPITFNINNTVVASNENLDCAGTLTFAGSNNWFQDSSCTGVAQGAAGLSSLADNGGGTLTHALASSSPLKNAGNSTICNASPILGIDQRGESRQDTCDIGAYEFIDSSSFFVIPIGSGKSVIVEL